MLTVQNNCGAKCKTRGRHNFRSFFLWWVCQLFELILSWWVCHLDPSLHISMPPTTLHYWQRSKMQGHLYLQEFYVIWPFLVSLIINFWLELI